VTAPRATSGDAAAEPKWDERLTLTVGPKKADLVGSSGRVLQAAVDYVAPILNQGTIVEYAPGGVLQISVGGGFSFSNAGTVAIGNGALVSVGTADYTQSGGLTTVDGALVAANVYLDGGVLLIQIAGLNQYGQLAVTGSAMLDGILQVSLLDHFVPAAGASFQILTFADYTGGFTSEVGLALPHHRSLRPVWDSDDLTLAVD
jgi:hypothetical protein